jgi:tRNA dimethylallyltransferase
MIGVRTLYIIVGPTAAGKSARAMELAPRVDGEILSADSRHVYRRMNIGTNKPTPAERAAVPHHLLDLREPWEPFSLAEYVALARAALADILARSRTPMLVGGTGQYIRALIEGWQVPEVPPDHVLRERLLAFAETHGPDALFEQLTARDPAAALTIDKRNIRRVIRALEVMHATGHTWTELQRRTPLDVQFHVRFEWIYVNMPREQLYAVADARIDAMIAHGWLDEVRSLLADLAARGVDADDALRLPALSSLGYRELAEVILGRRLLPDAVDAIRRETRRFIRMQDTWFRRLTGESQRVESRE